MQNKNKLAQLMMIAGSAIFLTASGVLASLSIETNMENAVQTIKRIIITDDGTASGTHLVEINRYGDGIVQIGQSGDIETKLKVQGNIEAGEGNNQADGQYASVVGGEGNQALGAKATIVGGINNLAEGQSSTVAGGEQNINSGNSATIVGGQNNIITSNGEQATIGGGKNNIANAHFSSIPGGVNNETNADFTFAAGFNAKANHVGSFVRSDYDIFGGDFISTADRQFLIRADGGVGVNTNAPGAAIQVVGSAIFGDIGNTAPGTNGFVAGGAEGHVNIAEGEYSSVGGGIDNDARGDRSTIGGGSLNEATSSYATVAGGDFNRANSQGATIGGGRNHKAYGQDSTVAGGYQNRSEGSRSTVGGGLYNNALDTVTTVGGGSANTANGSAATIGGGSSNRADGAFATVPGGKNNNAYGNYSFAVGNSASAKYDGTFVRADNSTSSVFEASTGNQFIIRAGNGVGINTNITTLGNLNIYGAGNGGGIGLFQGGASNEVASIYIDSSTDNLNINRGLSPLSGLAITPDGKIGIGTQDPQKMLQINNDYDDNNVLIDGANIRFTRDDGPSYIRAMNPGGYLDLVVNGNATSNGSSALSLRANNDVLLPQGRMGIRDNSIDGDLLLDVNGKVGATAYCDENGDHCTSAGGTPNIATCGMLLIITPGSSDGVKMEVRTDGTNNNACQSSDTCTVHYNTCDDGGQAGNREFCSMNQIYTTDIGSVGNDNDRLKRYVSHTTNGWYLGMEVHDAKDEQYQVGMMCRRFD